MMGTSETEPPSWVMYGSSGVFSPFSLFLLLIIFAQAVTIVVLAWAVRSKSTVVRMVEQREREPARPQEEIPGGNWNMPRAPEYAGEENVPPPPRGAVGGRLYRTPPVNITDNDKAMQEGVLIAAGATGSCYHRPFCNHAMSTANTRMYRPCNVCKPHMPKGE